MATTSIHVMLSPVSEIEASELDKQIRGAIRDSNRSFARLAYYGWRLKLANGFEALGFKNEYVYMATLGIGKTRWFEAVAVGQALSSLSLEDLEKIPIDQAVLLLSVKPELKTMYPWVEEAQTDDFITLARKIEDRNRIVPGPARVPMCPVSFRVPATAKEAIYTNLIKFKEKHDLASVGQALEFLVADRADDTSAIAILFEALKLLNGVATALSKREDLKEERKWLGLARMRVDEVYRMLLESSREDGDEVREEEVHATEDTGGDEEDTGGSGKMLEQYGRSE
jgi:hypothetical protein